MRSPRGTVDPAAPACIPASQRVGLHLYDTLPDTMRDLEKAAVAAKYRLRTDYGYDPKFAIARIIEQAGLVLDLTDPARSREPLRQTHVITEGKGETPPPGTIIARVERWNWRVEIAYLISSEYTTHGSRIADRFAVILHEDPESEVPPTRNLTYGFWGTWKATNALDKIPAEDGWEAMFELYAEPGTQTEHNNGLRDLLDSRAGRHYVDTLSDVSDKGMEAMQAQMAEMGRPDKWYNGEYGTPVR